MTEKNAEMEYILLRTVADAGIPVGAGYLADTLQSTGKSTLSEATIGRYLRQFEQRGYLKSEKYDGRSRGRAMSEAGLAYLRELEVSRQQAQMVQTTLELFTNSFGVQLKNVLAARQIIEPETAALAAANATSEDIARLRHRHALVELCQQDLVVLILRHAGDLLAFVHAATSVPLPF